LADKPTYRGIEGQVDARFEHVFIAFPVATEQAVDSACGRNLVVAEFDTTAVHRQVNSSGVELGDSNALKVRGTGYPQRAAGPVRRKP